MVGKVLTARTASSSSRVACAAAVPRCGSRTSHGRSSSISPCPDSPREPWTGRAPHVPMLPAARRGCGVLPSSWPEGSRHRRRGVEEVATGDQRIAAGVGATPGAVANDGAGQRAPADGRRSVALLVVVCSATAGTLLVAGLDAYRLRRPERAYAEGRDVSAPTGAVGWTLGVAGTLFMLVGVMAYAVLKRWMRLIGWG